MELIIYTLIFIMGAFFGSFFTLAVYRIPLGIDILYEHSFCPNCNNKLKTRDLIPIISYILLGGKCRNCGQKIRIRYLLIEVLSGAVFVLLAFSFKVDLFTITIYEAITFFFFTLYITVLFIIAGIDKEINKIQSSVLLFGLITQICFMIYICIMQGRIIYTYIICLLLTALVLAVRKCILKEKII